MKGIFYKIWNEEWCFVGFTRMSKVTNLKSVYLDLDSTSRKKVMENDNWTITELDVFDGSLKDMYGMKDILIMKHDPNVDKKKIYNKRYYKKYSVDEKYNCDCGSKMLNRKQVIEKHKQTNKHQKYIQKLKT